MKLKVSSKTVFGILATLIVGSVLSGVITLAYVWKTHSTIHNLIRQNVDEMIVASELDFALLKQRGIIASYIIDGGNEKQLAELNDLGPYFRQKFTSFRGVVRKSRDTYLLDRIDEAFQRYDSDRDKVIALYRSGKHDAARKMYLNELNDAYRETSRRCDKIVAENKKDIDQAVQASAHALRTFSYIIVALTLLFLVFGAALLHFLIKSVFRPIHELAKEVRSMSTGDDEALEPDPSDMDLALLITYLRQLMSRIHTSRARLSEERLEDGQSRRLAAVGNTVARVAHEIKNRMMVIGGFARRIEKKANDTEDVLSYAKIINGEVVKMEYILREVTDYSRPANDVERTRLSLNALVKDVVAGLRASVPESIRLNLELAPNSPDAPVDPERIEQVLINIIKNAMEALGDSGTIRVSTRRTESGAEIIIEDDGPGIPPELRERVFEPFFTTKRQGTGLGLAICRQIMVNHGGNLSVESGDMAGARFVISIPER